MALKGGSRHCRPAVPAIQPRAHGSRNNVLIGRILHNVQGNKLVIARTFAGAGGSGGRRSSTGGEANDDVTQISQLARRRAVCRTSNLIVAGQPVPWGQPDTRLGRCPDRVQILPSRDLCGTAALPRGPDSCTAANDVRKLRFIRSPRRHGRAASAEFRGRAPSRSSD